MALGIEDRLERNRLATQLAGAALTHFLADDEKSVAACIRQIPDPPGPWVGMLRFAALAVAVIAEDSGVEQRDVAQQLLLRVAELQE
ncbi:hypothetical protein ThrDRAFT_04821 [Frankia casuarinae]|jgi:hypothetical protein|uniref:Uncharacterized protein n=1 Tax=Frankia casuarinae (strain DSM 45818 / CECT 9043 / HFP020203 / CcI3) TaxID=106370 RepID=Q2J5H7_FRACC|nr:MULTISPECIES: hypothetical protein [Frankia]ABD13465.1 hypothetical protein Francci3_4117 [Frankia casuarinae]ESZ99671.1 hypothetical protein CcI6DRAFT_04919 [Frankia sp. CcI6]EYT89563.1 hypothetical protein ThrDRAFT_04821 [Frankia casuarinae]KFB01704.1 hypothetical protein ALLO2DRAFT_04812 [Frankia sp. Allo2]OHV57196.1 hypothetical protein CgIS1_22395 [Frankia sp. CgIS1]